MNAAGIVRALVGRRHGDVHAGLRVEPRWPVGLAILAVLSLFSLMPERLEDTAELVRLRHRRRSHRADGRRSARRRSPALAPRRAPAMLALASALLAMTLLAVALLVMEIMDQATKFGGPQLLTVGIEAWVTNVLAFSIVYWDLDRGGPEIRASDAAAAPDWLFPQVGTSRRGRARLATGLRRLPVPRLLDRDRVQRHRRRAAHRPRQIDDDARKLHFARHARYRRLARDQHPRVKCRLTMMK